MSTDDERQGKRSFNEAEMGLTEDLVEAIADQLGTRAKRESSGLAALAERKDLEPSALAVLMTVFGTRAEKDRRVLIPGWSGVGNVDLLLRRRDPDDALAWMCELKWCGPGNDEDVPVAVELGGGPPGELSQVRVAASSRMV